MVSDDRDPDLEMLSTNALDQVVLPVPSKQALVTDEGLTCDKRTGSRPAFSLVKMPNADTPELPLSLKASEQEASP